MIDKEQNNTPSLEDIIEKESLKSKSTRFGILIPNRDSKEATKT